MEMKKQFKGTFMLLLTAIFWGFAFVTQTTAMDHVGPFTFQATRQLIGFLVLLPLIAYRDKRGIAADVKPKDAASRKSLLIHGAICGFVLFAACTLQQFGIVLGVSAGKSGFITALYIVLVPLSGIFFGKKTPWHLWFAVLVAVVGLCYLFGELNFAADLGELLTLLCAFCFALHILHIDHIVDHVDAVRLAALQYLFCSLYSLPFALLTEEISLAAIGNAWLPIVYTGVFSSGVAYTLQIIAQKHVEPTVASLTMSTEAVFAALFGWLVIGQTLSPQELFGCALMFFAIIVAQLPQDFLKRRAA